MFLIMVFKGSGNIPPQNKDFKVPSRQKICLIRLFLSILWLKSSESSVYGFGFS